MHGLTEVIAERAVWQPVFRRGDSARPVRTRAIRGAQGSYLLDGAVADVSVPATLHAAIAARVDRLGVAAKRTLSAAAVIGSRFTPELVAALGTDPVARRADQG